MKISCQHRIIYGEDVVIFRFCIYTCNKGYGAQRCCINLGHLGKKNEKQGQASLMAIKRYYKHHEDMNMG
jgi:hypothetical protein